MTNAKILRLEPNATYIPLTRVGVCVFRYQHVGTGNAKLWRWGSKTTPVPNANGFGSQWSIGLNLGG